MHCSKTIFFFDKCFINDNVPIFLILIYIIFLFLIFLTSSKAVRKGTANILYFMFLRPLREINRKLLSRQLIAEGCDISE